MDKKTVEDALDKAWKPIRYEIAKLDCELTPEKFKAEVEKRLPEFAERFEEELRKAVPKDPHAGDIEYL